MTPRLAEVSKHTMPGAKRAESLAVRLELACAFAGVSFHFCWSIPSWPRGCCGLCTESQQVGAPSLPLKSFFFMSYVIFHSACEIPFVAEFHGLMMKPLARWGLPCSLLEAEISGKVY